MKRRTIIIILLLLCFILCLALAAYYLAERTILPPASNVTERKVPIRIRSGATLKMIANQLHEEGVITKTDDFIFTAKLFKYTNKLKAGEYLLSNKMSNYGLLKILVKGAVSVEKVVIPEGYTARQIASLLRQKVAIDSAEFMRLIENHDFIEELGIDAGSLEGYLYPNTYNFYWGINVKKVIGIFIAEFNHNFTDSLKHIAREKHFTINQVLTLASIIEGEAMVDSERAIISAVYHNRLETGMLLQADPTIQFIIPDGPRRLLKKDLAIDSPYNTYKYTGLPPGPVNNPGIKSIIAAIYPAEVPYLYFVARGDGSHNFSRTLQEHLRAKSTFDQYRREVRRKENARNVKK